MSQYDLSVFSEVNGIRTLGFDLEGGATLTGVEIAAQKFATMFLTYVGSVRHVPDQGTLFVRFMTEGVVRHESELEFRFDEAAQMIVNFQEYIDTEDAPDNEVIADVELLGFEYLDEKLVLTVYVVTVAEESTSITMPVATVEVG
jgi:hypothetical protein